MPLKSTTDDGVYIHLTGQIALCAHADGTLQLFAYKQLADKVEVIPQSAVTFERSTEGQTVLVFSDAHLVVEVPKDKADATLSALKFDETNLKVIVEAAGSSKFQAVMTSDPPPPGSTKVDTNRVG